MLFGETGAVYCENRAEHTATLCMQFVPYRKHVTSPLQGQTFYSCLGKQSLFIVRTERNTQIHSVGSPYLTGHTLHLRYRAQPVNAVWETVAVYCENHTEHTNALCVQTVPHRKHVTSPLLGPTCYGRLGKHSLFIVRTERNTQIHSVGSPNLSGNTLHLRYRAQPVMAVWRNSRCL
jgi:hypothetical protein